MLHTLSRLLWQACLVFCRLLPLGMQGVMVSTEYFLFSLHTHINVLCRYRIKSR